MLLWLIFAGLTAAVLAFVLRPVFSAAQSLQPATAPDLAVYTAQLADLEFQVSQGRLDPSEYDAMRHEVARRILRLGQSPAGGPTVVSPTAAAPTMALAAAAVLPLVCIGAYLWLGRPDIPSHPFTMEANANTSGADLLAKIEARLAAQPDDSRGWELIAPIYFRQRRFADAADAYDHAIKLLGESKPRLTGFAEAIVLAHDGIVTDTARLAYEKLAAADPADLQTRFWLALAKEQDGQRDAAATTYRAILAESPADAPWRSMVEKRLAAVSTEPRGKGTNP